MRLLLILAIVAVVLAVISVAVPTAILFSGVAGSALGWIAVALLIYFLDLLAGGWVVPVGGRRIP